MVETATPYQRLDHLYAGFWRRFAAMVIDTLLLLLPTVLFEWGLPFIGSVVVTFFYFPIFESSFAQTTPGKYVMGLRVTNELGGRLSFTRAVIRFFAKYASALALFLGYILQVFTPRRQALHDMLAGAVVIRQQYIASPNWAQAWLRQMRWLLRAEGPVTAGARDEENFYSRAPQMATSDSSAAPESAAASSSNVLESIERLHELYKAGALSEEEFQAKKSELLRHL
ncbi:MAG: RDD family protein [Bdellovibrionales bacterium]